MKQKFIKIANGCENNLKNVAVNIEKGKFTVVTGVSGSGKSSLVYNTLYKESQRLYFSTFPSWSRKYLGVVSKPKADSITGLDATIVIDQKTGISNQRSTAGTFSGIYDMLRLLFSRFGEIPE
ncbi:MAG TPA: excinuclease ABC subunit A, partial [bacterium]|nr:excinuclease ABC subunit A [bacterium]